jgi:hypothetical protein
VEATAYIAVQAVIDAGEFDRFAVPSVLMLDIHGRFYEQLPDSMRFVEEHETGRRVEVRPGALRADHVQVGHHITPAPEELPGWLARFDQSAPERFARSREAGGCRRPAPSPALDSPIRRRERPDGGGEAAPPPESEDALRPPHQP